MRRFLGLKSSRYWPWGRSRDVFRKKSCEIIEFARKIRDSRCPDDYNVLFEPVRLDTPIASVVRFLEGEIWKYS